MDPFCGSGSACIAAIKADRHYVGYDTEKGYVDLAEKRIREYKQQLIIPLFTKKESVFSLVKENQADYPSEKTSKDKPVKLKRAKRKKS